MAGKLLVLPGPGSRRGGRLTASRLLQREASRRVFGDT